ncbi:MAG: urea carboxylase [Frankiaceae bacterium]|nr:urea carboxylase [Frankiaceae bacterium]
MTAATESMQHVAIAGGALLVVKPGVQTTVQDVRGRAGYWGVGVPPSGAWDDRSATLANIGAGNDTNAALLEALLRGPTLTVLERGTICITGAATAATVDGRPVPLGIPTVVDAGQTIDMGLMRGPGIRGYLAIAGGFAVPLALGSRATFALGKFGGHEGRALKSGDELRAAVDGREGDCPAVDVSALLPPMGDTWVLRVVPGPHGAPEHLTADGVEELFAAEWEVDHRSDRTGVRLVGPAPRWARSDGGQAGMHPSNIHDSAYPVGGIMLSGGTPVIVGPDGPSLGGFVVPAVIVKSDRWQLAQARPGDRVLLRPVTPEQADALNRAREAELAGARLDRAGKVAVAGAGAGAVAGAVASAVAMAVAGAPDAERAEPLVAAGPATRPPALVDLAPTDDRPSLTVRRAGDHHLLVEAGPPVLDLVVRLQIHLLALAVADRAVVGIVETVEGVRSLLFAVDELTLPLTTLATVIAEEWAQLADVRDAVLPTREVFLPIALDDPTVHEAMQRYQKSVRPDAPWCPDNVEFIRRVNGLEARDDVFGILTEASYLTVGLGDVYLGAPVAVPLDPAHRLVTTKYDPARTWTPENAVGIGGIYLCVYGMEGPGGYQLVGRTVPVWRFDAESGGTPWLLRLFDRLRFVPVTPEELLQWRDDIKAGRRDLDTRPATLTYADVLGSADTLEGAAFTAQRTQAFDAERARWAEQGLAR